MEISVRNINQAYSEGLWWLKVSGVLEQSRNGPVLVSPEPVTTTYRKPTERLLFDSRRNCNHYFHLFESLWMLAGREDLEWPLFFNSKFSDYSDNGLTINGAYGYRWRFQFEVDQIQEIITHLEKDPSSRRAVLQMWDPKVDIPPWSKDHPCNVTAFFDIRNGSLNMTVCNRSNDAIFGAYGANVVHFSVLQEYIAFALKVPVGVYRQFSNNFHLYTEPHSHLIPPVSPTDLYDTGEVKPYPIISTDVKSWDKDLRNFMKDPLGDTHYNDPFFSEVAYPMYKSYYERKTKANNGMLALAAMPKCDWRLACENWITRKEKANELKTQSVL